MSQPLSELTSEEPVPCKVHIRGVDNLTTSDITAFSSEHFPHHEALKIEWIDDSSANLVFDSAETAAEALRHLTLNSDTDLDLIHTLQLRAAKPISSHPTAHLLVRLAVVTDHKRPRAHEASRFYMMHPEHDPRDRRRQSRRSDSHGYRRRRFDTSEQRRRNVSDAMEGFNASMYDDDENALAQRCKGKRVSRTSFSSDSSSFNRDSQRLHPRDRRRSRDRSASPDWNTDPEGSRRQSTRRRTPPPKYRYRDPYPFPKENCGKELFPSKSEPRGLVESHRVPELVSFQIRSSSVSRDIHEPVVNQNAIELFPNKKSAAVLKKELFPLKSGTTVYRRSDAFDAADETADLFASGMTVPFVDGAMDRPDSLGRLRPLDPDPDPEILENLRGGGFSIRGIAKQQQDMGISIRGVAAGTSTNSKIKELFPGKAGNAGKELFTEKLQGRGGRRNKASDMFN